MKMNVVEKIIEQHNKDHPSNGILAVSKDSLLSNSYSIRLGMVPIMGGLTLDELFESVASICNYVNAQQGD